MRGRSDFGSDLLAGDLALELALLDAADGTAHAGLVLGDVDLAAAAVGAGHVTDLTGVAVRDDDSHDVLLA